TVGEVADGIESVVAELCSDPLSPASDRPGPHGGCSLAGARDLRAPTRDEPAVASLPRAGSAVLLRPDAGTLPSRLPSPVSLRRPDGSVTRLLYGTNAVDLPGMPGAASVDVGREVRLRAGAAPT